MFDQLTRRHLFGTGARSGAALLLGGSAAGVLAANADASPPAAAIGAIAASDLAYVRLLIGAELLMVDFYTEAVASKHLHGRSLADARLALITRASTTATSRRSSAPRAASP
jgi:hypothetical protein